MRKESFSPIQCVHVYEGTQVCSSSGDNFPVVPYGCTHQNGKKELPHITEPTENPDANVTVSDALEIEEALFYKGFRARKTAFLKMDDDYIVCVKNQFLKRDILSSVKEKRKVYKILSL